MDTQLLHPDLLSVREEFREGKVPRNLSEVAVNGNDLMEIGLQGKAIGTTLNEILRGIYSGKLSNEKSVLLDFALNPRKYENENY